MAHPTGDPVTRLRKLAYELHKAVTTDRTITRAIWYGSAGTMAWMEVADGHHFYGCLIALLSVHYENMPRG